jgi:hypothetical protein
MLNSADDGESFLKPPQTSLMGFIFDAVQHLLKYNNPQPNIKNEINNHDEYNDINTPAKSLADAISHSINNRSDKDTPIEESDIKYNLQRYVINES